MSGVTIHSLRLEELSFAYQGRNAVIENVTLDLPIHQIVWVAGPSGAGKSVLIRLLSGYLTPTSGRYLINGRDVHDMTFEEFMPYRIRIGYSFDFGGLINNRTIEQNLLLPLEYHRAVDDEGAARRVREYMDLFNLTKISGERPASVPGGSRKATCVARAFILAPEMLLLDDPTTGLHGDLRVRLKDLLIAKKRSGELRHVFVATDDTDFIADIADVRVEVSEQNVRVLAKEVAA